MSDTIVHQGGPDRQRTAVSLVAALVIHVAALLLIWLFVRLGSAAAQPPTIIDVQLQAGPAAEEPAGPVTATGPGAPAGAPASPAAAVPRAAPASGGEGSGFVIPTPSGRSADNSAAVPRGPAFQTTGAQTGVAESLPPVQTREPAVTVGTQGKTSGAATGPASTQRSGQGVVVTGSNAKTGSDSLDLSQFDKSMAGRGGTSGGSTAAAAGGSGTATTGTGAGKGGTGQGTSGSGGAGAGGTGSGNYRVLWDQPDASKGRILISSPEPKIPAWVSKAGLTLKVTVAFTLLPSGVVSEVTQEKSTGYADVDAAVIDAIRHWRFSAVSGGGAVKGEIPYIIRTR